MVENIAAILLFSIPEGIVVTYLASSLQARKIKMAQIVLIGILFGLAVEFLNVSFLQTITGVEPTRLQADFSLRLLWFLSQVFIVVVLSLIIRCFLVRKLERKKTDHDCG